MKASAMRDEDDFDDDGKGVSSGFQTIFNLMRCLPVAPKKGLSAEQLKTRLLDLCGSVQTVRTIQRHLNSIRNSYGLEVCTDPDHSRTRLWRWPADAEDFAIPNRNGPVHHATHALASAHLHYLLPAEFTRQHLKISTEAQAWLKKVAVIGETQPRIPPQIDSDIYYVIASALEKECQAKISRTDRDGRVKKDNQISPLALIQRGFVVYVACRFGSYMDPRLIPLHRISKAELLEDSPANLQDFDLQAYIRAGRSDFGSGKKMRVHLRFTEKAGDHLEETPLSEDQQLIFGDENGVLDVIATVNEAPVFDWWVRAMGDRVTVLAREIVPEDVL